MQRDQHGIIAKHFTKEKVQLKCDVLFAQPLLGGEKPWERGCEEKQHEVENVIKVENATSR